MTIIAEDGTGLNPNANSFADEAFMRTYAKDRGVSLPDQDGELSKLSRQAVDHIEGLRGQLAGSKVTRAQPLQYPRKGLCIDGFPVPETEVPIEAKFAQCALMVLVHGGLDINPTATGPAIKRTKTDVLETEFAIADGQQTETIVDMPSVDRYLNPLLGRAGGFSVTVRRA